MVDNADLLFELGTEELPPTALKQLSKAFTDEFVNGLQAANLSHGEVTAYAAPRRLGILVRDCALQQPDQAIEKRGPAVKAAFDAEGKPTRAAEGFASSCGVSVEQLNTLETDKGQWLVYQFEQQGKPAVELLPQISQQALDRLPIPKRMRWGSSEAQFVRPVHWLCFLLGDQVVPCRIYDTDSADLTYGHRFHHPQAIRITSAADYARQLQQQGHVIAHFGQRREQVLTLVNEAAASASGKVEIDEDLLDEVTALVEWPVAVTGQFDAEYLEVPHEALILTMKKNQKYFPVFDQQHKLKNAFITIANIDSSNPETIRKGNERVVRPRLADAKFFWEQDAKLTLEARLDNLRDVVFQKQLGSIYDKSRRVASLAAHIAGLIGGNPDLAERAGLLSRCDLVTEMVFEFADMQGVMGRYQALRDGEPKDIAQAMEEIYLPRFAGDRLPHSLTGIAVALADRLDTLTGIFGIGLKPSGTKDPFALRRASLGIIRILREHGLELNLHDLIHQSCQLHKDNLTEPLVASEVNTYIYDRLKGVLVDEGTDLPLVRSVASVNPDNLVDFDRRIAAVTAFSEMAEAEALAAANKRIHNILKKTDEDIPAATDSGLFEQAQETNLMEQVSAKESTLVPLLAEQDYAGALHNLAGLKQPIDDFFDEVMVMTDNQALRQNRLSLLQRVSALFLQVADVSVLQES